MSVAVARCFFCGYETTIWSSPEPLDRHAPCPPSLAEALGSSAHFCPMCRVCLTGSDVVIDPLPFAIVNHEDPWRGYGIMAA